MMKLFFDKVKAHFGSLSQSQVDGINILLAATSKLTIKHRAYVLATAWHETATTMQPIHERGNSTYFQKYEFRKSLGNTLKGDGFKFRGRGYVQITGRANYAKASKYCGADLVANPDLALDQEIAAKIILSGMSEGWFTGKKMADFDNYEAMRRVVNGTDKAALIARHAVAFENALSFIVEAQKPLPVPSSAENKQSLPEAPKRPWWKRLLGIA
jgi:putative chitinase